MRRFALMLIFLLPTACSTLGGWADDSMAWADRTMPTYDDWFGDEKPPQTYTQRPAYPAAEVETQPTIPVLSTQQEMYYDDSERGYSFETPIR